MGLTYSDFAHEAGRAARMGMDPQHSAAHAAAVWRNWNALRRMQNQSPRPQMQDPLSSVPIEGDLSPQRSPAPRPPPSVAPSPVDTRRPRTPQRPEPIRPYDPENNRVDRIIDNLIDQLKGGQAGSPQMPRGGGGGANIDPALWNRQAGGGLSLLGAPQPPRSIFSDPNRFVELDKALQGGLVSLLYNSNFRRV